MMCVFLASKINLDFFYIFFNLLLLCVFAITGQKYRKGKSFASCAIWCVLVFSTMMGLRYRRGFDYLHYSKLYLKPATSSSHYAMTILNDFLKEFGVDQYAVFFFYALPFVIGAMLLLRHYRVYAHWLFPVFLMATQYFEECFIRQALGFSFVFFFISEFMSSHKLWVKVLFCALLALLVFSVHNANVIFCILFLTFLFAYGRVIPYWVSIPSLVFANYFFSRVIDLDLIMPLLDYLKTLSDNFAHYIQGDAAEQWFGESALQLGNERNPIIQVCDVIAHASLFYFAYKVIGKGTSITERVAVTLTNLYVIGDVFRNAFLYYELINRMSSVLQMVWFVPFSIVMTRVKYKSLNKVRSLMYLMMFFLFYDYLKFIFAPPIGMTRFLWDI